jgi:CBS domain containing-hemolysin-like protein
MLTAVAGLLAVVVLTIGTGFFVAQEFAFVAADRNRMQADAEAGDKAAARAVSVMRRVSFVLSGAQLGITITGLVVGYIAEPAIGAVFRPLLEFAGVPDSAVPGVSVAIGFVLATVVQMVLGELGPKNWGIADPERVARMLAAPTLAYVKVFGPVIRIFDSAANWVLRRVGIEPAEEVHGGATADELDLIIEEATREGHLPPHLSDLLDRALDFADHTAAQAMVPRPEVAHINADETADHLVDLLESPGHSRYPVLGSDDDDVVGVVGVKELLTLPPQRRPVTPVRSLARPAVLVPGTLPLPDVLDELRAQNDEFACVVDEYGGLAGVLTLEDIAEELVGELHDENDAAEPEPEREEDGSWTLPGDTRIDEAERATGIVLPQGPYETLGGLAMSVLGRMPALGDEVDVPLDEPYEEHDRVRIRVVELDRRVPDLVRIMLCDEPPAEAPEPGGSA